MDMKKAIQLATAQLKEMSASDYIERLRKAFESPVTNALIELTASQSGGYTRGRYRTAMSYCVRANSGSKARRGVSKCLFKEDSDFFDNSDWKGKTIAEPKGSAVNFIACAA